MCDVRARDVGIPLGRHKVDETWIKRHGEVLMVRGGIQHHSHRLDQVWSGPPTVSATATITHYPFENVRPHSYHSLSEEVRDTGSHYGAGWAPGLPRPLSTAPSFFDMWKIEFERRSLSLVPGSVTDTSSVSCQGGWSVCECRSFEVCDSAEAFSSSLVSSSSTVSQLFFQHIPAHCS